MTRRSTRASSRSPSPIELMVCLGAVATTPACARYAAPIATSRTDGARAPDTGAPRASGEARAWPEIELRERARGFVIEDVELGVDLVTEAGQCLVVDVVLPRGV